MMKTTMIKKSGSKGYTLLFSIIVAVIVLSVAAFILTVSRKAFILASAARDSTVAIYAADSGVECAIEAFDGGSLTPSSAGGTGTVAILYCGNASWTPNYVKLSSSPSGMNFKTSGNTALSQAQMIFPFGGSGTSPNGTSCAVVTVTDGTDASNGRHMTVIDSSGYNVGCTTTGANPGPIPGPRAENRTIRLVAH